MVVETPPAVDNDRRPKGHTPYGATRSDQRAAGLGRCKRGQKDKLVWEFENCEVEYIDIRSKGLVREFVLRLV